MTDVLVVNNETLVSIGLKMILESVGGFSVATCSWCEAHSTIKDNCPPVILLDIQSTPTIDMAKFAELRKLGPATAIAVLTTAALPQVVIDALRGGACGFLLRDSNPEQLVAAVRALAAGSTVLAPEALAAIISPCNLPDGRAANDRMKLLSAREQSIIKLLSLGLTNTEIGRRLFLSDSTVKEHVSVIIRKLGVSNRVQAAIQGYAAGLVTDEYDTYQSPEHAVGSVRTRK